MDFIKTVGKSMPSFLRKRWVLVGILLVLVGIGAFLYLRNNNGTGGYIMGKATLTTLTEVVSESGEIVTDGNVAIYAPTTGIVQELFVKNGESVAEDQPLFSVKSSATAEEQQVAYTNYLTAKAALDADTASLYTLQSTMFGAWKIYTDLSTSSTYQNSDGSPKTANRVLPEFTTAQNDWLAAEAQFKNQQGVIAKDNAALATAWLAYEATQTSTVKAQLAGIISNITVATGSSVAAQNPLVPTAKPVLILTNSQAMEARIPVGQTNIAKVAIGQAAVIKPDAYKNKTYSGKVTRIDDLGENIQGVVTYNVYIDVAGDPLLRPGMTVDANITTQTLPNVLTVPNSAITLYNGLSTVRILENKTLKYLPVTVGVKGETRTQILRGMTPNQDIVVSLTNEKAERPGFLGL